MSEVQVVDHCLVQHKLSLLRNKTTSTAKFRALMREVSMLLGYEVTKNMPLTKKEIETPFEKIQAPFLQEKQVALVPILRAGNGILEGFLQLIPTAKVGHIGLYRDPVSKNIIEYYLKLPEDISTRRAIVLDPLLATGSSAVIAINRLKEAGSPKIIFVCLIT